ncbi:hemoglobin type 1, partial [Biomphalaria glabrata]
IVQRSYASNESEATSSYESCPYVNFEWKRPEDEQSGHHACMTGRLETDGEEVTCTTQVKFRQNKQSKLL